MPASAPFDRDALKVGIIGLGYVGLPLAVAFGAHHPTVGFDINAERIATLRAGRDETREVAAADLAASRNLTLSDRAQDLAHCNFYIVTVPTPIDTAKRPDLDPIRAASRSIASVLRPGDIVVYESTVFPGATEEVCVPLLESGSGLVLNRDFFVGYSPERINPGDPTRRLTDIVKVTSGSTPEAAQFIDEVYGGIVTAGTHLAGSIRIAEAAKVIENTQRDLNIALMNELAMIFNRLGIDTEAVLEAAGTKWNFMPFRPGLVGGHCIGVDPYYLTHKAEAIGYHPQIILAGRRLNDSMGAYVAGQMVKTMIRAGHPIQGARVLIMGLTFKENCPDLRNTRVVDVIAELQEFGIEVEVHDPWANPGEALREYGISLLETVEADRYDGIILAVPHDQFRQLGAATIRGYGRDGHVLYDLKHLLAPADSDVRL